MLKAACRNVEKKTNQERPGEFSGAGFSLVLIFQPAVVHVCPKVGLNLLLAAVCAAFCALPHMLQVAPPSLQQTPDVFEDCWASICAGASAAAAPLSLPTGHVLYTMFFSHCSHPFCLRVFS